MAKPFSIQAPEEVAKEYGGNKQKIAQAAQMGIIDPTAAVLAGMFIDRMRGAQKVEGANPPTVAQDVMGGAPAQPAAMMPAPAPLSPGGLGATPQAAPPMAPPAPMPAPDMQAPMGMAAGGMIPPYAGNSGLSDIPVPDGMFDEPSNGGFGDGYAGGGLVAFAAGGPLGPWFEEEALKVIPGIGVTSRERSAAKNAQVGGVSGSYHLTNNARDFVPPKGMDMAGLASKLKSHFGAGYDIINEGDHVHVEPGSRNQRVATSAIPTRNVNTPEGQIASAEDIFGRLQERFGQSPEEKAARAKMMARAEEMASDENYEKSRKSDMWQTLAEIGFNMASSKSPYLLQAVGEAASAAMPGARADKKERKAIKDKGLDLMVELGASDRKEAQQLWGMAVDAAKTNMQQQQFERRMGLEEKQVANQAAQIANQAEYQKGMMGLRQEEVEAGKGPLQQIANAIYGKLVNDNETGRYMDRRGKLVPYKVADEEIRARAYEEATKLYRQNQQTAMAGAMPGLTGAPIGDTGGGQVADPLGIR